MGRGGDNNNVVLRTGPPEIPPKSSSGVSGALLLLPPPFVLFTAALATVGLSTGLLILLHLDATPDLVNLDVASWDMILGEAAQMKFCLKKIAVLKPNHTSNYINNNDHLTEQPVVQMMMKTLPRSGGGNEEHRRPREEPEGGQVEPVPFPETTNTAAVKEERLLKLRLPLNLELSPEAAEAVFQRRTCSRYVPDRI